MSHIFCARVYRTYESIPYTGIWMPPVSMTIKIFSANSLDPTVCLELEKWLRPYFLGQHRPQAQTQEGVCNVEEICCWHVTHIIHYLL